MKAVVQRVKSASVSVAEQEISRISEGYLIFLGVFADDGEKEAELLWRKITKLRIFPDSEGKTNLDIHQAGGNVLIVSQFTLAADCRKGNRPSFTQAASPEGGRRLYEYFLEEARLEFPNLQTGEFGAHMMVNLENWGPFTILLDTDELSR